MAVCSEAQGKGRSPGGVWASVGGWPSLHRPLALLLLLGCCEAGGSCDCLFVVLFPSGFFTTSLALGLLGCTTHNFHSYASRLGDTFELNRAPLTAFTLKLASLPVKVASKPKKIACSAFCCFRH